VDLGFLGNKLNIEADYFNKKTTDIIVQLSTKNKKPCKISVLQGFCGVGENTFIQIHKIYKLRKTTIFNKNSIKSILYRYVNIVCICIGFDVFE
jgi:hypothetical protein